MLYYKLKSKGRGFKLIGKVSRMKKGDDYLYLTQEEIDKLNPDAVEGYEPVKNDGLSAKARLYQNLNKR